MAWADELTDKELNELLERFDKTDPALRRRIVAQLISDRDILVSALNDAIRVVNELRQAKEPGKPVMKLNATEWMEQMHDNYEIPYVPKV